MNNEELAAIYNEAIDGEGKTVFDGLRAVAEAEREACAQVCDRVNGGQGGAGSAAANECAIGIRRRSNDPSFDVSPRT